MDDKAVPNKFKICSYCNKKKSSSYYHKKPDRKDGLDSRCKSCVSRVKKKQRKRTNRVNQLNIRWHKEPNKKYFALCLSNLTKELLKKVDSG